MPNAAPIRKNGFVKKLNPAGRLNSHQKPTTACMAVKMNAIFAPVLPTHSR
ncbi:MAG: hypothetical protein HY099_05000 [Nitrospirae bacterium]|nr:hypothetical protein [Nitrospirota bacterium]